jgi:transposase
MMKQRILSETLEQDSGSPLATTPLQDGGKGQLQLRHAVRDQIEFQQCALDDLLPPDDQARVVWEYVCSLDLSGILNKIRTVEGEAGRPAADPKILMTLWLFATLRGVGAARELDRRCKSDIPFRWICGGVTMNYHTLADFRTAHEEVLDHLLATSVASLVKQELVSLDRIAQDGMKVRANAGAASFRSRATLEECLIEAVAHVKSLRAELEADPAACKNRHQSSRQRAAEERTKRIRQALAELPKIEASKKEVEKDNARASTTDPEARVMKMGDGGFRPAFNVQFATATNSLVITSVIVTNSGGDRGQLQPMIQQLKTQYEQTPKELLVDGGFAKKEDIEHLSQSGTTVYAPVMKSKDPNRDAHTPRPDDSPAVAEWRKRMATDEAKQMYKERASTAECVNALARNRGLRQFLVRGLTKVKAVALWFVLAHNMMRTISLRAAAVQMV